MDFYPLIVKNQSLFNVMESSSASLQQRLRRCLSCSVFSNCLTLYVIYSGFHSALFLASLIPREGEENLFQCDCQVQFLLAGAAFVKHAVIKPKNQTLQFLNGMLENYLQANKSCVRPCESLPVSAHGSV